MVTATILVVVLVFAPPRIRRLRLERILVAFFTPAPRSLRSVSTLPSPTPRMAGLRRLMPTPQPRLSLGEIKIDIIVASH